MSPVRIAIIDLYGGEPNEGMRCIRDVLVQSSGRWYDVKVEYETFEARASAEIPGLEFDAYLSTGGPGSPFDGVGTRWESLYFDWLASLVEHNRDAPAENRKHAFFICHSFQVMCRYFELGAVVRRRSQSFGIFPVHATEEGTSDPVLAGLSDPFYAADFRHWQVVQPSRARLKELGARILAYEKIRPHVELERAVMGIRLSPELVGVQFHPEADAEGMLAHFSDARRREAIINDHGEDKYARIVHRLRDPEYLDRTHRTVLPAFVRGVVESRVSRPLTPP